jgi:hypothetical protein
VKLFGFCYKSHGNHRRLTNLQLSSNALATQSVLLITGSLIFWSADARGAMTQSTKQKEGREKIEKNQSDSNNINPCSCTHTHNNSDVSNKLSSCSLYCNIWVIKRCKLHDTNPKPHRKLEQKLGRILSRLQSH